MDHNIFVTNASFDNAILNIFVNNIKIITLKKAV